jgi:ABC-2 type transport system permease protein
MLYGSVVLAIGLFASSLTENQIVAVVLTYAILMPLLLVDALINLVGLGLGDVLSGLSIGVGLRVLARGIVDSHYLILFSLLTGLFLFLSAQVLDSSRWR